MAKGQGVRTPHELEQPASNCPAVETSLWGASPAVPGEESGLRSRCIRLLGKSGPFSRQLESDDRRSHPGDLVASVGLSHLPRHLAPPPRPSPLPLSRSPPRGPAPPRSAALGAGPRDQGRPGLTSTSAAGPTGESHRAGAGPGPRAPPSTCPRPGARLWLRSLAAAGPAGGHGGGRLGQAGAALAEGAGRAAERGAAAAAGGTPLQRRGRLVA